MNAIANAQPLDPAAHSMPALRRTLDGFRRTIEETRHLDRPAPGWRSHLVTMLMGTWLMVGLFVDGWAHSNLEELETFFTPWHALFYSGFAATAGWMGWLLVGQARAGRRGLAAVPRGYGLGLFGVLLFGIGGFGDMLWHIAFGVEQELDSLLSPTHLLLLAAMFLILSSPFRAAWSSADPAENAPAFRVFLPTALSAALVVSLCSLFTLYASAFNSFEPLAGRVAVLQRISAGEGGDAFRDVEYMSQRVGLSSILVTNALLLAPLLLMARRWRLPFGTATVVFTLSTVLVTALESFDLGAHVLTALAAGLASDALARVLRPSGAHVARFRTFSAAVPLVLWSLYLLTIWLQWGVAWSLELTGGIAVFAALEGLAMSVLVLPPAAPHLDSAAAVTRGRATPPSLGHSGALV